MSSPTDQLFACMSDDAVRLAAAVVWPPALQAELSDLLADQLERRLTPARRARLDKLMAEYRAGLLAKAMAVSEAVRRGLLTAGGVGCETQGR